MSEYEITFFQVETGNCCLMSVDDMNIVFDIHSPEDENSYDLIKPFLPKTNGKRQLDVLCISHGHKDHCGGFKHFKEALENNDLTIGSIWHPNYDRTKVENEEDLSEDYIQLHEEIISRKKSDSDDFGDIQVPLTAWDKEEHIFKGLDNPNEFTIKVLSPYRKDDGEEEEWDVNDISLVLNVEISGLSILFPGDSEAKIWQERIIPYTIRNENENKADWACSDILITSHHGSYTFFGEDRDDVRTAEEEPENYEALDFIEPKFLVVSAKNKFPINGDSSGDQPPHYAAWKWYHQWFEDNRGVSSNDNHPDCFWYTSEGHIRLGKNDDEWIKKDNWTVNKTKDEGFISRGGRSERPGSHYG